MQVESTSLFSLAVITPLLAYSYGSTAIWLETLTRVKGARDIAGSKHDGNSRSSVADF